MMFGSLLNETSSAIRKRNGEQKTLGFYGIAFLSSLSAVIAFSLIAVFREDSFVFDPDSLPTFSIRVILEIAQITATAIALVQADRSSFAFGRTLTVPLLLLADILLGYSLSAAQIAGVALSALGLVGVLSGNGFSKKAFGYVLFSAVNAAFTISLYKYDIEHFNSVVGEQLMMYGVLIIFSMIGMNFHGERNPILLFVKNKDISYSFFAQGASAILESFAFKYAAGASMIMATQRVTGVLWALFSGRLVFHEEHMSYKLAMCVVFVAGIFLML